MYSISVNLKSEQLNLIFMSIFYGDENFGGVPQYHGHTSIHNIDGIKYGIEMFNICINLLDLALVMSLLLCYF